MKRPLSLVCLVLFIFLCIRAEVLKKDLDRVSCASLDGEHVSVCGRTEKIEIRKKEGMEQIVLYLKHAFFPDKDGFEKGKEAVRSAGFDPEDFRVIVYTEGIPEKELPRMGSSVTVEGKAFAFENPTNPGQFDALLYYRTGKIVFGISGGTVREDPRGGYDRPGDMLFRLRLDLDRELTGMLPEHEASVMKTVLLGEKGQIGEELRSLYSRSGIAHILSISALHISILGMGCFRLLRRMGVPMRPGALLSSCLVFSYGILTGFSVSTVRAVLMFVLSMGAVMIRRTYDPLTALSLTACLILGGNPLLLFHTGFAYSFGCVGGILLLGPVLDQRGKKEPVFVRTLRSSAMMCVILLPLYLWFDFRFPVYASLVNLMVIPVMSLLVPAGFLLLLLGKISPSLCFFPRIAVVGIIGLMEGVSSFFDSLPGKFLTPGKPGGFQIVCYLLILIFLCLWGKKLLLRGRWAVAGMAVLILLVRIRPGAETTFLDVGQGDGIFLRSKDTVMLIDGGSSSVKEVGKYRILPFLKYRGVSGIDAVLLTHSDEDHVNGILELMEYGPREGIRIDLLLLPSLAKACRDEGFQKIMDRAEEKGIPVRFVHKGQELFPDRDMSFTCLWPEENLKTREMNESSLCLLMRYGNCTELFTGDIEGMGEKKMTEYLAKHPELFRQQEEGVTLLKVAHHGSGNSTPEGFLSLIRPRVSVISCEFEGAYGHPHKELLDRLTFSGTKILRTDTEGAVTVTLRRKKMNIKTFIS